MRFPPHILDEIRSRLSVSQVVGRKVALKKQGREFAGLSPFKTEKTPSFFVNDQKGFYHCFASGEHGDIFTFLIKTEGLSFPEAVERLAEEAGVTLPKPAPRDPESRAQEDERERLYRLLETSAKFFEDQLHTRDGREASGYLVRRGLSEATVSGFRLGYAPHDRTRLKSYLSAAGFTEREMITSGMLIGGPDIPTSYDRFRHRVMFPITDHKSRVIAFGGRALDDGQPAKYLNSPETPLFHKGWVLFNLAAARPAAHEASRIIVVEGYMDVIALAQAGVKEAVAPLGTALTQEQVQLLWRIAPEPILCFDGDSAGRKAAHRALDTALPHLKPGVSLSFAFMPDGLDPDDMLRQSGREGFEGVMARARGFADVLFSREWDAGDWSTPERRAGLELQIRKLTAQITDDAVRSHYERDMRDRLFKAWRPQPGAGAQPAHASGSMRKPAYGAPAAAGKWSSGPPGKAARQGTRVAASSSLKQSRLVAAGGGFPQREVLLIRTLLNHPWLVADYAEEIADIQFSAEGLAKIRDGVLSAQATEKSLDRNELRSHLTCLGLDKFVELVERSITHRCDKFVEPEADAAEVETGFCHSLALHESQVGLQSSLRAAWHEEDSSAALAQICEIKRQPSTEAEPALSPVKSGDSEA
ncbi:DNA primase [Candidatus Filomicrobium marinum]|uniref:DNA primase n=1 Tax=Candidatus Filomicrobium marinum TaxID=1608628 RepID=A0A0D6JI60_9HYPH|nr:DNA primase [Candidatus Filomicrobium marinum]CFX39110.1 DNA primase [Candidatus Filomicrobium marinum]CPR21437.1 DNA primase [Candidatus Filomicrobium marinum]